jgi:L-lactate dehydrogenase complex protein LldG
MANKQDILNAVKANLPKTKKDHPFVPCFEAHNPDLLSVFKQSLERAGGTWHEVDNLGQAKDMVKDQFAGATVFASATEEWPGNRNLDSNTDPRSLEDVDVGIIRAEFGVAEMGSVWLTQDSLKINALGFLSQHLVILLDPLAITENMHTAYEKIDLSATPYGCFMMGPSATADIGATLVHGAQGARSLTVFFLKKEA